MNPRTVFVALAVAGTAPAATPALQAQGQVAVTELSPGILLLATPGGNLVASVGADGAFLIGALNASTTREISALLAERTQSSARYVVVMPSDTARSDGDAGWGRLGAWVVMHENALGRLAGSEARLTGIGAERPRIAYSEVITFNVNGSVHVVHQPAGHSDADALAHFHAANLVYLGEIYPGDGYPLIDSAQGGTLDGLVRALESWTGGGGGTLRFVPARGPVARGEDIRAFRDMLVAMRDRVRALAQAGRTAAEVVAALPSAEFDARWGHGRVTPEAFVRALYRAVGATR